MSRRFAQNNSSRPTLRAFLKPRGEKLKLNKTTSKYKQTSHYFSLSLGGRGIRIKKQTNKQTNEMLSATFPRF